MPCDYKRDYPDNWNDLRRAVLLRAGLRCEGSPAFPACRARQGFPHPVTGKRVALQIAHKDGTDTMTQNLDDLMALCPLCHSTYDAKRRRRHATAQTADSDSGYSSRTDSVTARLSDSGVTTG